MGRANPILLTTTLTCDTDLATSLSSQKLLNHDSHIPTENDRPPSASTIPRTALPQRRASRNALTSTTKAKKPHTLSTTSAVFLIRLRVIRKRYPGSWLWFFCTFLWLPDFCIAFCCCFLTSLFDFPVDDYTFFNYSWLDERASIPICLVWWILFHVCGTSWWSGLICWFG